MAREPSAHYKAISAEVEMLRKRENSNMRRIKSLEDELKIIKDILRDLSILPAGKKSQEKTDTHKPDRAIYEAFNAEVAAEFPGLVSLWSIKDKYGFASEKTVTAILENAKIVHSIDGEVDGVYVKSSYAKESEADEIIRQAISGAIVCLDTEEDGTYKDSSLKSNLAVRNGSPGKFRLPVKTPAEWVNDIAEREALRECRLRSLYEVFIDGYAATYGVALNMDSEACKELIDNLIHSGKIIRDGNTIKAAS